MKKNRSVKIILLAILVIIAVLFIIVFVRTLTYPFPKVNDKGNVAANSSSWQPSELSLQRFAGGIRIPTISTNVYEDTDFEPFDEFVEYLREVYPAIYNAMEFETVNQYGLVFRWKGRNSGLKPILFLSHYDVVPVIGYEGRSENEEIVFRPQDTPLQPNAEVETEWIYPPFSGAVADGRIYGRGTLDMKCMMFGILEAADALIAEGYTPEQDIWLAFGHDEEVGGREGAVKIAEYFKRRNLTFDAVYDEGGLIDETGLDKLDRPLAIIGIGEKGFLTVNIKVYGIGGHSSMPPAKGSLVLAGEIIGKLNNSQLKPHIISPVADFLDVLGSQQNFAGRMVIANQWLFKPLLINMLAGTPQSNALIRTTTAVTMAKGSDASNVMTSVSEVTVNFRILPGETVDEIMAHVKEVCEGYEVELEVWNSREPSSISPVDTKGYRVMEEAIASIYPQALVTSYITIGGTDAYKYQSVSDNIYRFIPILLSASEQRSIHNENEYISLENYGNIIEYFRYVMTNFQNS